MLNGMPHGIQQQQSMHRRTLLKYILFFITADNIELNGREVKLKDFTIIPNFFDC